MNKFVTKPLSPLTTNTLIGKRILIVDDNPINLSVAADYLGEKGFVVLVARDGESALAKAPLGQPDLILLDVMMPGIDGFETCRRLKANPETENIPIIFMTALAEVDSKVRGFTAGAVDYVTKPIQQEELLARVLTHLSLRDLNERLEQKVQQRTAALQQRTDELEQRKAELQMAYQKLQQLDKAKSNFIRVISHELRTPLSVIFGYTQLINTYPTVTEDAELKELVAYVLGGSERILEIINQSLELTKIEQGSLPLFLDEVSIEEIITGIYQSLDVWQKRDLKLVFGQLAELPLIKADPDLLTRTFYQLILNAIKYTPNGGRILVTGKVLAGDEVEIAICDTGIGIDAEHLELIFEKFYQTGNVDLHSSGKTTFKGGGPGLGLAIAKGIVEAHQGRIWAESPGHDEGTLPGTCFFVRLPIG